MHQLEHVFMLRGINEFLIAITDNLRRKMILHFNFQTSLAQLKDREGKFSGQFSL